MNFNFKFQNRIMTINAQCSNGTVYSNEFRPYLALTLPDETDFQKDVQYMISAFEKTNMSTDEDFVYPLLKVCEEHIKKYGRLIDNDLFAYIDQMTLILKAYKKLKGIPYSLYDGQEFWKFCETGLFNTIPEFIWVDKKRYYGFGQSELVPLNTIL